MRKVKGIYENKTVKLLEDIEIEEGTKVEVIFPEKRSTRSEVEEQSGFSHLEVSEKIHKQIKESILKEIPELARMSPDELKRDFQELSKKVASSIEFDNWKEAERFIRGMERYDPRGH